MILACRVAALAALLATAGCEERSPAPPMPSALAATATNTLVRLEPQRLGRLASGSAFDLVSNDSGITLLWAPADRAPSAIVSQALSSEGKPLGGANPVLKPEGATAQGRIAELGATSLGAALALAWLRQEGEATTLEGTFHQPGPPSPALVLGQTTGGRSGSRGALALQPDGDSVLILSQRGPEACVDPSDSGCVGFGFHRLNGAGAVEAGLGLAVPKPCKTEAVTLQVVGRRWHYALCSNPQGRQQTTLFTIQRDPEYARADQVLEGCEPLGMLNIDEHTALVADCAGTRVMAKIEAWDEPPKTQRLADLDARCEAEGLLIHGEGFRWRVSEPTGELGPLLPSFAKRADRAVWSGSMLLVATERHGALELVRYRCGGV